MKRISGYRFWAACLMAAAILAGCRTPLDSAKAAAPGAKGSIALTMTLSATGTATAAQVAAAKAAQAGRSSRTLAPDPAAVDGIVANLSVRLTRSGYEDITQVLTGLTGTISDIEQGSWSLTADARNTLGDTVAQGSASVTIASPGPNAVTLPLTWTGGGQVTVTLQFPHSVGISSATGSLGTLSPALSVVAVDGSTDKVVFDCAGVDTGSPLLRINLYKDGDLRALYSDRVWVYPGIPTAATVSLGLATFSDAPAAPSGLVATPIIGGTVRLTWVDVSNVAEAYIVEKSEDNSSFTQLGSELAPYTETISDTVGTAGGTYYYRVLARNRYGSSFAAVSAIYDPSVETDLAALAIVYQSPDAALSVTKPIGLPASGANGASIQWLSDNTDRLVISSAFDSGTGNYSTTLTRPALSDVPISLTALVSKGSMSATRVFAITMKPVTDAEAVALDKPLVAVTYSSPDTVDSVKTTLSLPAAGAYASAVSWASDNAAIAVSASASYGVYSAAVTRPDASDLAVNLVATIARGSASDTKNFALTVKATGTGGITITSPSAPAAADLVFRNAELATISGFVVVKGTTTTVGTSLASATSYAWHLDNGGATLSTAQTCGVVPTSLALGSHTLKLIAVKDGKTYSGRLPFTLYQHAGVLFEANGGSGSMAMLVIPNGASLALTANAFTKTGYSFAGWATTAGGAVAYAGGASYSMASAVPVSLYAKWSATVTYDSQSATTAASPVSATLTLPATTVGSLPTAPAKTGYSFGGWWTATGGGGSQFLASTTVSASLTVYAKWSASVSYDSQSATTAASPTSATVTLPVTTVGSLPTAPAKTGYSFAGWWTATGGGGSEFLADSAVGASITVYAKWTATVSYDSQSATTAASPTSAGVTLPATTVGSLPTAPAKTGYSFGGWWTQAGGGGSQFLASTTVGASLTVYAKWTATVTYDGQSATTEASPTNATVTYPATTVGSLPTAPARTDYTFGGWYTATGGGGSEFLSSTTVSESLTVYAKWTAAVEVVLSYTQVAPNTSVNPQGGEGGVVATQYNLSGLKYVTRVEMTWYNSWGWYDLFFTNDGTYWYWRSPGTYSQYVSQTATPRMTLNAFLVVTGSGAPPESITIYGYN